MATKTPTTRRLRQPELVRARLLSAATELLNAGAPLSIGSVAEAAGVSKGAVQHHFGTREQLFSALYDSFIGGFEEALSAEQAGGVSPALAYARAALQPMPEDDANAWRALLIASVLEREIAARWSERARAERALDGNTPEALLVRLAADGLWLSDLLATYEITDSERAALMRLMERVLKRTKD